MEFRYFFPSDILKPYVRHYFIFESDSATEFEDTVFPSGDMEVIFNLGGGTWESSVADQFVKTPAIELWGQITKPLLIRSKGKHAMLGIKFFTHSAAYFFDDEIGFFNDQIFDLSDIFGNTVKTLHAQLMDSTDPEKRLALMEGFLIQRLAANEKRAVKVDKVAHLLRSIQKNPEENKISDIASSHGITPRYLQKIIYQNTGLSPKSFHKINRFQQSLKLLAKNEQPFTSIAYECGYFDQSHFIRDFKSFTGITPSAYLDNLSPVNMLIQP